MPFTRRRLLRITTVATAGLVLPLAAGRLRATPECDDAKPTRRQTEGPFYSDGPPRKRSLIEPGVDGRRMIVKGHVIDTDCNPVPGARMDFWHASPRGQYDNDGYRFRGWLPADESGAYELETLQPGHYPGRTSHIHVKVHRPDGKTLTTQMYFPWDDRNARDGIFNSELLVDVERDASDLVVCRFDFVLG